MRSCRKRGDLIWMIRSKCLILGISGSILKSSSTQSTTRKGEELTFSSFAKQIYPSNFTPSPCHRWIKLLEDKGLVSYFFISERLAADE
jgi:hypothetical protein